METKTFWEFKISPMAFPTSVIRKYTWRGEDDEIKFDGVEVNGFLLTTLDGDIRVWNTWDKDFAILSTILPFVRDQTEKNRLHDRLVEITKWHSCRRERGNETQSPRVTSPSQQTESKRSSPSRLMLRQMENSV